MCIRDSFNLARTIKRKGENKEEFTATNTLDFRNLTQHRTDLRLGIITQMSIAHLIKILEMCIRDSCYLPDESSSHEAKGYLPSSPSHQHHRHHHIPDSV